MTEKKIERILEILIDHANAQEANAVNMKRQIADIVGVVGAATAPFATDVNKLPWQRKQGMKGEYEQTSKRSSNNSDIFQALQQKLKEYNGFWQHQGLKYWNHQQDQDVIDRRKS